MKFETHAVAISCGRKRKFSPVRKATVPMMAIVLLLALSMHVCARADNTQLIAAQKRVQQMARGSKQALSLEKIAELQVLLDRSRMLGAEKLDPATIEAIGNLLSRAGANRAFQSTYLDDFPGLWARVGIDVDARGFAVLSDGIAVSNGRKQDYGSLSSRSEALGANGAYRLAYASNRNMLGITAGREGAISTAPFMGGPFPLASQNPAYPTKPKLRAELLALAELDQAARREPEHSMSDAEEKVFIKRMDVIDARTLPRIRAIFNEYGFPTAAEVGRAGTHVAFLLVQHAISDPDLMIRAARDARPLMEQGDLPYIDYALLVDRVACVIEHRPQLYGTQGNRNPQSYWYCPIAAPSDVNDRRAKLLLPPLSNEKIYGATAAPANRSHTK